MEETKIQILIVPQFLGYNQNLLDEFIREQVSGNQNDLRHWQKTIGKLLLAKIGTIGSSKGIKLSRGVKHIKCVLIYEFIMIFTKSKFLLPDDAREPIYSLED